MSIQKVSESESKTGRDPEKGAKTRSEVTSLPTEEIEKTEEEIVMDNYKKFMDEWWWSGAVG